MFVYKIKCWDEEKCRFLTSCCKKHDSPTLWIRNSITVHFWSTPWHRRGKPMWISHYINGLWRSLIFPYFTYSDVFRQSNKKKKHWGFVSKLPNIWFQSLRCFFQIYQCLSDSPKGQKVKRSSMTIFFVLV